MSIAKKIARRFTKTKLYNYIPDKWAVSIKYWYNFDKKLELKNPQTFNEKLQWLKLYDRKPEYTRMVDKYEAKKYVADVIGEEYIIPTLGVWDTFDEIEFDKLPNQFALKCTHGSGDAVICKDKTNFDKIKAKEVLEKSLETDYYLISREWPYKNVQRRIIAEQFLSDISQNDTRDYKLFCFDGKVKCFKIDFDRFVDHHANWYDRDGKLLPYGEIICPPDPNRKIEIPQGIEKMIALAEKLSESKPFLRVDFYCVNGEIYFGELTLHPASGLLPFTDEVWDKKMGEFLRLP